MRLELLDTTNPNSHNPTFTFGVKHGNSLIAKGSGRTKLAAKEAASIQALRLLHNASK
jgi:dsRNA-specific ribonuclease